MNLRGVQTTGSFIVPITSSLERQRWLIIREVNSLGSDARSRRDARHAARSHALVGARGQRGAAAPGNAAPVRARAVAALLRRPGGFWLGGAGPWQHSRQCRRGGEQNGWYPRAVHRCAEGLQAAQALRLEQGPLPSPALPLPRPASRSQRGLAQNESM